MGAYSPYPREINIYFLQGGYIYTSTDRVAKERGGANKKRERTRGNESKTEYLRDIRSYCEIEAITLFRGDLRGN